MTTCSTVMIRVWFMVQLHQVPCEECYVCALRGLSSASLVLISRFAPCASGAGAISTWEQQRRERGCQQTGNRGLLREGLGKDVDDGLRPAPVSTTALLPTVPFKVSDGKQPLLRWIRQWP
ncbi:hypothetical protein MDA_GLEAN10013906 [Myotis davidii]|uniref:Uncharacterized protein n=1 Tax=Myotis davidii TaxID=225400 RepID=L5MF16_MYODS|nr:hypothetical protein MDA_GLEAN10013906 [Myotis davidii]